MKTFPVLYAASLATNMSPQRTDAKSISKGMQAFSQAKGCRVIVAGGYSQGAAVMHNVVSKLDAGTKAKVAAVALFGDTRNKQDRGHIPNFPQDRSRVWCKKNDGVCGGALNVNAGHMSYNQADISQAATYLASHAKGGSRG
jgi:cutinase